MARKRIGGSSRKQSQRATLLEMDGPNCWLCGFPCDFSNPLSDLYATLDHVNRHSDGGRQVIRNMKLAHRVCNELRGAQEAHPDCPHSALMERASKALAPLAIQPV